MSSWLHLHKELLKSLYVINENMYICSLLFLYFRRAVKISISQVLSFRTKLPELCAPDGTLNINFDKNML